ncbi:actin nucleation-promoting factor WAS [Odontesthes bonariensis]|uniref:actin nucleation-promoting factor WAS n=1 Tax=Odontesthes bonariensis TaxID=219752 RepID=UPI003F58988F
MAYNFIIGAQVMSDLLTIREKGVLVSILEPHCKIIKTTVAQLLQAKDTQRGRPSWRYLDCGVICLTEDDSTTRSYFLRLYCVKRAKLLWEQEIHIPFKYTAARPYFHTLLADVQVGLNFENETEAEEFLLAVEAVQKKMNITIDVTKPETASSSSSGPPDLGKESLDISNEESHFPVDAPSTTTPMATCSFKDMDSAMRRLLMQARLSEEDLKDKDVAEAVDCIINQFGGLTAVQRELRKRDPGAKTLPRSAGASFSHALQKGPLPPVPSIKSRTTSQGALQGSDTPNRRHLDPWHSSLPPASATERKRKSLSFKYVGNPEAKGDLILTALREVFKQKQMLQQNPSKEANQLYSDTENK